MIDFDFGPWAEICGPFMTGKYLENVGFILMYSIRERKRWGISNQKVNWLSNKWSFRGVMGLVK